MTVPHSDSESLVHVRTDRHGGKLRVSMAVEPWVVELPPSRWAYTAPEAMYGRIRELVGEVCIPTEGEIHSAVQEAIRKELGK
jgi:hypothetical protein